MATATTNQWRKAVTALRDVLSDLDESELLGCVDDDGDGTWRLVEIVLKEMWGKPIPFEDRSTMEQEWRRVTIKVETSEAREAELRCESGELVDEVDTPLGVLQLYAGNNSLQTEFGLYYRLAPAAIAMRCGALERRTNRPSRKASAPT